MLRSLLFILPLACTLGFSACNSDKNQQQPSAMMQKRIQEEQRKVAEQQRQLTSGYDKSMSHVAPNTGASPKGSQKQHTGNRQPNSQQDRQQ
jgi:hypothetical protein